jgi:GlpG protein
MRQIGMLTNEADAQRFAAYLITQGVIAHAEEDQEGWVIWVRDENHLETARDAFETFRINPADRRYQGAERQADTIRRNEIKRRDEARKNVVEMRGRWGTGGAAAARRAPLVFVLIALSVLVTLWTSFGKNKSADQLLFVSRITRLAEQDSAAAANVSPLADIRRGQVWRLVTPIFLHFSVFHLVFNVYALYYFGAQIEDRKGTLWLALLVLAIALISNVAQAVIESAGFGGMSGVVYGLFGYVWMKTMFEPSSGLHVSGVNVMLLIFWFFLCLSGWVGLIANAAHGAGLVAGVAIGYAPVLWRR